jgi:hypothetical protein
MKHTFVMTALAVSLACCAPAMAQSSGDHKGTDPMGPATNGTAGVTADPPMAAGSMTDSGMTHGTAMPNGGMSADTSGTMKMSTKKTAMMKKKKKMHSASASDSMMSTGSASPAATPSAGGLSSGGMTAPSH